MQRVPGFLPIYSRLLDEKHIVLKKQKIEGYNFNFRGLYIPYL
jgi:IS1 family transposase